MAFVKCPSCQEVSIPDNSVPLLCSDCGGPVLSCRTCGTGRQYWIWAPRRHTCPTCGGDPLVANSGRPDWKAFTRAKMVARFGPRQEGDLELLDKYCAEVVLHG